MEQPDVAHAEEDAIDAEEVTLEDEERVRHHALHDNQR